MKGKGIKLPENAYTKMKKGESYKPIIPAKKNIQEITVRSVGWGIFMAFLFSAAAAYLGLKVATVFEAAIPIAILAVGLSSAYKRRSTILENVIIQSIGAASGAVVAGAIFTLPAIFILGLDKSVGIDVLKLFIVALVGGFLGIVLLIPFRKYFVADMHGKFPFPEATATTEVLVTGEQGGNHALILLAAASFAGIMDFLVLTVHSWAETISTTALHIGQVIHDKFKFVINIKILASITGLGYIIGLKYTSIIVAGSFLSWLVLVPLVSKFGVVLATILPAPEGVQLIAELTADQIFTQYVRHIGIGAIAAAGIIGIIKSSGVIKEAFTKGFQEMFSKSEIGSQPKAIERTDRDMKMSTIIIILVSMAVVLFVFFRFSILGTTHAPLKLSLIALGVVLIISFLFTSVAARAIAIVGTNPVSGMTLMTLILTSVIMVAAGLKGPYGMMASLLIGGVVCTALSVAGAFVTDLKIGYWIGSTPWNQERFKFLGVIVSALAATLVIILLNKTEGFVKTAEHPNPLPAPQANAMAAILKAFMSAEAVPWILFGVGIAIAIFVDVIRIPSLAFALGMYIPQEYNIPLMIGGFVSYLLVKKAKDKATGRARREKGTLIASGFIAGGAIMGVVSALIKLPKWDEAITMHIDEKWFFQPLALLAFLGVLAYLYFNSKRAKAE